MTISPRINRDKKPRPKGTEMRLTDEESRTLYDTVLKIDTKLDTLENKGCGWGDKKIKGVYSDMNKKIHTAVVLMGLVVAAVGVAVAYYK